MPEIAEIETLRLGLERLVGARLLQAEILDQNLSDFPAEAVCGLTVSSTRRHGKLVGLELSNGDVLAFHMRMTGNLLFADSPAARLKLRFQMSDSSELVLSFTDPRRWGTAELIAAAAFSGTMGPDLWDDTFDGELLAARAGRSKRPVKTSLLDQAMLAGVGNYLADEALWQAQLHPQQPASSLEPADWVSLLAAVRDRADAALLRGGASFSDYRQVDGSQGTMQEAMRCYGRDGQPCLRCQTALEKTSVGGRGTTFCPSCQQ